MFFPQPWNLVTSLCFMQSMTGTGSAALPSFVLVIESFLGNQKAENYQEFAEEMFSKFKDLGMKMGIKIHISLATWIVFLQTFVVYAKSTEKGSNRTLRSLKEVQGMLAWWPTTLGVSIVSGWPRHKMLIVTGNCLLCVRIFEVDWKSCKESL